jgi:glycogen(starch) synthase
MKVLMTTDTVGGVWTYSMELARVLRPAGIEILLATMGPPMCGAQAREAAALSNVTLATSTWKLEWMNDPWEDIAKASRWLLDLERAHRPDVIHLNGYAHGALPWNAPVVVVAHSCVLSWWAAVNGEPAPPEWDRYADTVKRGIASANLLIAPTKEMLAAVSKFYGPLPASRVVYNARDPHLFTPRAKRHVIFAAGRLWDQAKNLALLEHVAPDLPWPVQIAGDDRAPDGGARARTTATRLLGKLTAKGMAQRLASAAIYCLPARYEPFGLSALEAALSGCALVLGDIPTLREVWDDSAIFVPPDDPGALKTALLELIGNPARRADFARRARHRACAYTPDRMVGAYLSIYRHLVTNRHDADAHPAPRPVVSLPHNEMPWLQGARA